MAKVFAVAVAVAPFFFIFVWLHLDANPTLYFYDLLLQTSRGSWKYGLNALVKNHKPQYNVQYPYLKGKTIWVTGASSGIGAELVCQLVEAEARHIILSSRNEKRLVQVAQDCTHKWRLRQRLLQPDSSSISSLELSSVPKTNLSVLPYDAQANANASTSTYFKDIVSKAIEMTQESDSIDIIFLNAGIYQVQPAMQTTIADARTIMKVNFESPVELVQTLMQMDRWKERGHGHIVVTGSLMSHGGHSLASTYSASKQALRGYFQSLSTEEFRWLRVDLVCPGAVKTQLWNSLRTTGTDFVSTDGAAMEIDRFVHLMLTGVTGPWIFFYETWISKADGLLWVALAAYMPALFHVAIHALGVARLAVWEKSGRKVDPLNLQQLFQALWTNAIDAIRMRQ